MTTSYKTIKSSILRSNLSDTLDEVERENRQILLIQRHGGTDAVLISIDLLESLLDSVDKGLLKKLKIARRQADAGEVVSFAEAFGEF